MKKKILFLVSVLLLAACGGDAATTSTTATVATDPVTTAATETTNEATTTAAVSSGVELVVASTDLGDIVTDADGATLYIFMPDAQGAPTCHGDCAVSWPPLATEVAAGDGVDNSLIGLVDRAPEVQATYNGWPLYYFSGDSAAGDINGQGLGDAWYVIGADGEPITG